MKGVLGSVTPGCRQRLMAHYGHPVTGWLDEVPEIFDIAARSWELSPLGYYDAGHASALALAATVTGHKVIMKAWFERSRYRYETAALRHWERVNGRVVRAQEDRYAVACLELVGGIAGGCDRPVDDETRVATALAQLHGQGPAEGAFPELAFFLGGTVEPRVRRRLRQNKGSCRHPYAEFAWEAVPAPTGTGPALLHGDLYMENVPLRGDGIPVFIDPLPVIGDPGFDLALFTVYYDLARDPVGRLRLAARASGMRVETLLPWCLRVCLDGFLYYQETGDPRLARMAEVLTALAEVGLPRHAHTVATLGTRASRARKYTIKEAPLMHDTRTLLDLGQEAVRRLARRGYRLDLGTIEDLSARRNNSIRNADELRAESKRVAQTVGRTAKDGGDADELKERARHLKDQVRSLDEERGKVESELRDLLLDIPNFPADDVPDGDSDQFNVEVRRHGAPPSFSFEPRDHVDLGEAMGILDFGRAAKLSGPRFSISRGAGAALERALASFFLALHTGRHGYTEFSLPDLVTRQTMTGTGQLPKFEEDLFKTGVGDRELFLIPTAEVPLTNLHAGEILLAEELPYAYTAWTPCYRSEAGSYGRDTRGILRLHQFSKVELVRVCRAEDSRAELETMLSHAEACLKELGLAYRVVKLAAGDLGFAATFTYDIEVWLPSQNTYREISSCSDCGTFQARRASIRTRAKDGHRGLAATLNGSGLPIGRTMAAMLEQHQQQDGSVTLPNALVPLAGFSRIAPDGTPQP